MLISLVIRVNIIDIRVNIIDIRYCLDIFLLYMSDVYCKEKADTEISAVNY